MHRPATSVCRFHVNISSTVFEDVKVRLVFLIFKISPRPSSAPCFALVSDIFMAGRTVQMLDYHWNINSCLIFFCRIVCLVSTVSSVLVFTTAFDTCVIQAVMSFAPTKRNSILFRNLSIFPRWLQAPVCSWLVIFARSKSWDVFGATHQFQGIFFTFFPFLLW